MTIRTTDREGAGTDANVYVTLIGSNGDSGKRWMLNTLNGKLPSFEPGATDSFKITSVDIGTLKQVRTSYQPPSWFLHALIVILHIHA